MNRFPRSLWAAAIVVVLALISTVDARAQTPTPAPGGDCCSVHAGPACDLAACAECVCVELDEATCCQDGAQGWDEICVALAVSEECTAMCQCSPAATPTPGGDCCSVHGGSNCDDTVCAACVCAEDDLCCSAVWDATCVTIARNTDECAASCTTCTPLPTPGPQATPTPGACCEARDLNPGCDDDICETCVCGVDSLCCTDTWDGLCLAIGAEECALECVCADDGQCCVGHEGVGCNDRRCQDCVVGADPGCGDPAIGWDTDCADRAAAQCALECPCGDCCAVQDVPGCGDKACQECVCDVDEACCSGEWDGTCQEIARDECSIDCPCNDCCESQPDGSSVVGCGEKSCQECVCATDDKCCTEKWDGFCVDGAEAECEAQCSCAGTSTCCVEHQEPGCDAPDCEACVCALDSFCCDEFWDGSCADDLAVSAACSAVCQCPVGGRPCVGDCNQDRTVAINELIVGVRINLGQAEVGSCPAFDGDGNGSVSIGELIQAVNAALNGCPA